MSGLPASSAELIAATVSLDANGNPLYDFDGHVHGDGLDLDAYEGGGSSVTAPAVNKLQWLRVSNAYVVADEAGGRDPASGLHFWRAVARSPAGSADDAFAYIFAGRDDLSAFAQIAAQMNTNADGSVQDVAHVGRAKSATGDVNYTVMNDKHESSFVQTPGPGGVGKWELRRFSGTLDIPNTGAATGGSVNASIASLLVGDYVVALWEETAFGQFNSFHIRPRNPVSANGVVGVTYFNADTIAINPANANVGCLVLRGT